MPGGHGGPPGQFNNQKAIDVFGLHPGFIRGSGQLKTALKSSVVDFQAVKALHGLRTLGWVTTTPRSITVMNVDAVLCRAAAA
jgi:hypothetical protein